MTVEGLLHQMRNDLSAAQRTASIGRRAESLQLRGRRHKATIANHPQRLGPGPYLGRPSSPYWELHSEQVRCILFGNYEDTDAVTPAFGLESKASAGDCLAIYLNSAALE
jgi:hypothetical protein